MTTDRTKPSLPGEHNVLVGDDRRATPWYRRWFERVDKNQERVEALVQANADAIAAIPAQAYPDISGAEPVQIIGPIEAPLIRLDPAFVATIAQPGRPGMDGEPGEDGPTIVGPRGLKGDPGNGLTVIVQEDHYHEEWGIPPAAASTSSSGQAALQLKDEGSNIGSSGAITSIDFVGAGVSAAVVGTAATVTVSGGGSGAWTSLGTATVTGAAATTVTLSGLNLSLYKKFFISASLENVTASQANISLFYNADTTATNYRRHYLLVTGGVLSGVAANDALAFIIAANECCVAEAWVTNDRDSKPRARTFNNEGAPATITLFDFVHVWNSATNITSITLSSSVASALGIGSNFTVWGIS